MQVFLAWLTTLTNIWCHHCIWKIQCLCMGGSQQHQWFKCIKWIHLTQNVLKQYNKAIYYKFWLLTFMLTRIFGSFTAFRTTNAIGFRLHFIVCLKILSSCALKQNCNMFQYRWMHDFQLLKRWHFQTSFQLTAMVSRASPGPPK